MQRDVPDLFAPTTSSPRTGAALLPLNNNQSAAEQWEIFSHLEKTPEKPAIYAKRGGIQGGTYAHVVLALAYAEYLDPNLGSLYRSLW